MFDFRQQESIREKIYRRKLIASNYSERRPIFVMQTIQPRPYSQKTRLYGEKIVICHAMNKLKFKKNDNRVTKAQSNKVTR